MDETWRPVCESSAAQTKKQEKGIMPKSSWTASVFNATPYYTNIPSR